MSNSSQSDEQRLVRERSGESGGKPHGSDTATTRFREEIASKHTGSDDPDAEEDVWSGGYSPKAMIGTWLLIGIVSIALLIAMLASPLSFPLALILIVVIWGLGGLRYMSRRLGVHYQLTNQRFIHQTGILTRQTDRMEVIDIDDVSFTQGPIERILGVGTIQLTGSDRTHPTLSMIGIAEVNDVAGLLDDIRRTERRRRSLHIESI
jgi:membrane protein YdbS with pleckstrin-like domain